MTLIPIAERLAVELSLLVFTTKACRGWKLYLRRPIKTNKSSFCENESMNKFKFSKNVELHKRSQLLTVACIVNA